MNDWRTWAIVGVAAWIGWSAYRAARDAVEPHVSEDHPWTDRHPWG